MPTAVAMFPAIWRWSISSMKIEKRMLNAFSVGEFGTATGPAPGQIQPWYSAYWSLISCVPAIAQAAVDVELFTIPLYMTSLYSIALNLGSRGSRAAALAVRD